MFQIDKYCWGVIHNIARRLVRRPGRSPQDYEDIVQELVFAVYKEAAKRQRHPSRGLDTALVITIVKSHAANLECRRLAKKRVKAIQNVSLHELFEKYSMDFTNDLNPIHKTEVRALAIDVDNIMERLPWKLRVVAEQLRIHGGFRQTARALGRPQIYVWRCIRRLRKYFASLNPRQETSNEPPKD